MDDLSADAREILSEMRQADAPVMGARERVRRQLLLSIGSAAGVSLASAVAAKSSLPVAASEATAATTLSVAKIAAWVFVGAAAGTAVLAPVALVTRPEAPASSATGVVVSTKAAPPAARIPTSPAPLAELPETAQSPASAAPTPSPLPPVQSAPPRAEPDLGSETRSLRAVRELLRAGRAEAALMALTEHARLYPDGALREEAAASRVLALCALGRVELAERERSRFHAQFPRSPLGPRVERACGAR